MNNFNVFKIKVNDFLVDNKLKAIEISKDYLKDKIKNYVEEVSVNIENMMEEIVKIIKSFLKINCKLSQLDEKLFYFARKNNLKKNIFKDFKSIQNLKKLKQDINFITNFGRDVEYYTGIVFEVFSGKKEIARGGRYDDLLKSLGAKKNIQAVGAAINLKNI